MNILQKLIQKYSKNDVEKMYKKYKSISIIAKNLKCSKQTITRLMDSYCIKRNLNIGNKKHFFNEDYFKTVDTEEKAYWLGFIYADGCVYTGTKNTKRLQINLKYDDVSHLKKFQNAIGSDYSIQRKQIGNNVAAILKINSTKMCNDLSKYGVIERKSLVCNFPNIQQTLIQHFIRGYFDGDGCISFSINQRIKTEFSIVGGDSMMTSIGNILNIKKYTRKNNANIKLIKTTSKKDIIRIHDYLYKDSTIFLKRKKTNYDTVKYILTCPHIGQPIL